MATNVNTSTTNPTTQAVYTAPEYSYKNKKEFTGELDSNAFMKLMLEQLKYQDPLSPMDNQQFIQQTSMMTMVERLTSMEQIMKEQNSSLLNIREYESLIGKTATYDKTTENEITGERTTVTKTGEISSVKLVDGKIVFTIGDDVVLKDDVHGIESKGLTNGSILETTLKYSQMIGNVVRYMEETVIDADGKPETKDDQITKEVEKSGAIKTFSMKNGSVEFVLDNGKKLNADEIIGMDSKETNAPVDNTLKYAQMIGYKATYTESTTNTDGTTTKVEKNAIITALSMKNGLMEFVLDNGKKLKTTEIIGLEINK
ncbi:flagellar hook assembly protein FlgD [Brevibacillus dissolubilis]|uniref:flagellar hook assembly protein FlgD n=1 Tax=Brevibacillus dissolubilis TaxID=1844116 RepID=UPI0011170B9B|nr:flagellar hook capping FlgD N-terminal domain-containing protein [Brevibacillus dissolubilis]